MRYVTIRSWDEEVRASGCLDRPAVVRAGELYSYGDLLDRVESRSRELRNLGLREGSVVALTLERPIDVYATYLAVLSSKAIVCPIPKSMPAERRRIILEELGADFIACPGRISRVGNDRANSQPHWTRQYPESSVGGYVIFTSGSTGRPKGVFIPTSALEVFLKEVRGTISAHPGDRWLQHIDIGFDLSIVEIFTALTTFGALVPVRGYAEKTRWTNIVESFAVNHIAIVPSQLSCLAQSRCSGELSEVKSLMFCGEPLYGHHVQSAARLMPNASLFNCYGPTEATVWVAASQLDRHQWVNEPGHKPVPVSGFYRSTVVILEPAEDDLVHLKLSGPQLAAGYLHPSKDSNFSITEHAEKIYATGDMFHRYGSSLEFACRHDRQVKINGVRIELGEVDAVISTYYGVPASCCVHDGRVIAWVELALSDARAVYDSHVKVYVGRFLRNAEVPSDVYFLSLLPRLPSGKIDISALFSSIEN